MTYLEKCSFLRQQYQNESNNSDAFMKQIILSNIVGASFLNYGASVVELPIGVPITMPCTPGRTSYYNKIFKTVMQDLGYKKFKIIADYDSLNLFAFEILK